MRLEHGLLRTLHDNRNVRYEMGKDIWWMTEDKTVSRFNPWEETPQWGRQHFDLPSRPGAGLTYLIKCNTTG